MIRYAVVGAGWIAQDAFMPAVAQTGNSVMTAIVSGNAENAQKLADFYGIESIFTYQQYPELLKSGLVDAVYIALPNSMHAEYAIMALEAGVHVMVEKPIAINEQQTRAMIAASNASGALLMTEYRMHHEPLTVDIVERMRDKSLVGEPRMIHTSFSFVSSESNHRLLAEHWGGPLQDVGVYCINACRYLFGAEPIEVFGMSSRPEGDSRFKEIDATFAVTMRFPEGKFAQFTCSFDAAMDDFIKISGTEGTVSVEPAYYPFFKMKLHSRTEQDFKVTEGEQVDHFAGIIAYFSECIAKGEQPESDGVEGLIDVMIMEAIERSIETGLPQKLTLPQKEIRIERRQAKCLPTTDRRLVL